MLRKTRLGRPALVGAFLALAVLVVYLPVARFDFICYDDNDYVSANPPVLAGVTLDGVKWAFTQAHAANWHPLTWLSHMLDCQVYGSNAGGHHLTNVVFHIANTVLLFLLLRFLTGTTWRCALVAALFGLHPLHVESVAWVSERKDVLSTFFGLLSVWCYARYALGESGGEGRGPSSGVPSTLGAPSPTFGNRRSTIYYSLALAFFALSLMSKPMLVTLPFILLLLDYWPLRRFALPSLRHLVWEKAPFFAFSVMSCVTTVLVQKAGGAVASMSKVDLGVRVMNALVSYAHYVGKLFWPAHLTLVYPYPDRLPMAEVIGSALALVGLSTLAWWQRQRRPYLLVGWLWFLGTLVPVIGLVQVGNQPMADRYMYLPAIGLFIALAWGLTELIGEHSGRRLVAAGAGVAVLAACASAARSDLQNWRDSETLFNHAISVTSRNFIAYNHLGLYFAGLRRTNDAMNCYRTALMLNPGYQQAWNNRGCLLIDEGQFDEAITNCETALRLDPAFAEAHNNLATALLNRGRIDDALRQYSAAIDLRPGYAQAHYNLANLLAGKGQEPSAAEHYRAALRANPGWASAHNNLGYMLVKGSKPDEAALEFRLALAQDPSMWEARFGLAAACAAAGKQDEAIRFAGMAYNMAQAAGDQERSGRCQALLQALNARESSGDRPASGEPPPGGRLGPTNR